MLKKILSLLICFQFAFMNTFLPVLASEKIINANAYDFSDTAQEQFNQNRFIPVIIQETTPIKTNNFKREREKKEIKKNADNTPELFKPEPQKFYIPPSPIITETPVLEGSVVVVPAGTPIVLTFDSGISSGSMDKDDRLTTSLSKDWVYNNRIIAPKGSIVYGAASDAKSAGNAYGGGSIEIYFNQILTPDGNQINIMTEKISLSEENGRVKFMARDILVGVGIGVIAAALFVLAGGGSGVDYTSAIATSGTLGLIGGAVRGFRQMGKNVQIPNGTQIEVRLLNPINISPLY